MSRPVKIVLITVGVVVVLALIIPFFIDVDRYRPRIVAEAESRTGRKIEIGHIRARLLPTVGFSVENVAVGPPAGFAPVNLLTADSVKGSVSLFALLGGKVEVTSIAIEKPRVTLATDEHGRTNYEFAPPPGAKGAPSAPASGSSALALDSVSVRDAELSLVDVRGRNPQPPSVRVSGLNASFSSLDLSPAGMAHLEGEVPLSGLKVALTGLPPVSFRSGEVKIAKEAASGNCEIDIPDVTRLKGEFSIPDLQKLMAPSPAARGEIAGTGKFTSDKIRYAPYELSNFSAAFRAYPDHIDAPVTMSLYGGTLAVNARLDTAPSASGTRRFTATIQLSQVDLEKLAAADPGTRGKLTGHAEAKLQLAGALGGELMNSLTGQGSFALHDGKISGIEGAKSFEALSKIGHIVPGASSGGNLMEATYSSVQGDLSVRGGRVYTSKTVAETNRGKGDIHGSIGFDQTLDLSGTWTLAGGESSAGSEQPSANPTKVLGGLFGKVAKHTVGELPIPFMVKGTVRHPKVMPGGG